MFFDPMYFLIVGPGLLLGLWAQARVQSAFAKGSKVRSRSGYTGAQAAARLLQSHGLHHVGVEPTRGFLGDHYDPRHKVLRLSHDVYHGSSLAALGVAAHEAGHALQDQVGYAPLRIRNFIVPMAGLGSNMAFVIFFLGMVMQAFPLVLGSLILFGSVVVFQLVNLPVEYDASRRAREVLIEHRIIEPSEEGTVAGVLNAAALTYVAATLTSILTFLYFLMRSGILGGRRSD